jgi:hypothetical protein
MTDLYSPAAFTWDRTLEQLLREHHNSEVPV